jgi:membrane carboxypeptidase/penicillin-binding protein PbpC
VSAVPKEQPDQSSEVGVCEHQRARAYVAAEQFLAALRAIAEVDHPERLREDDLVLLVGRGRALLGDVARLWAALARHGSVEALMRWEAKVADVVRATRLAVAAERVTIRGPGP